MIELDQEPLEPELIGALRADVQCVDSEARERVAARLTHSVGVLSLGRALATTRRPSPGPVLRAHSLGLITSFAIGGLCGAGLYGVLRAAPTPSVVYVDRPVMASAPANVVPSSAGNAAVAPSASAMAKPLTAIGRASAAPIASNARNAFANLAEQQALLDAARSAFARSDYSGTLALLKTHAQRFPRSVLGEERAALEIKALAGSGRTAEAAARAARFAAQFPQSLLSPSINDSLRPNP